MSAMTPTKKKTQVNYDDKLDKIEQALRERGLATCGIKDDKVKRCQMYDSSTVDLLKIGLEGKKLPVAYKTKADLVLRLEAGMMTIAQLKHALDLPDTDKTPQKELISKYEKEANTPNSKCTLSPSKAMRKHPSKRDKTPIMGKMTRDQLTEALAERKLPTKADDLKDDLVRRGHLFDDMTVAMLKCGLEDRDLPKHGNKENLVVRYEAGLKTVKQLQDNLGDEAKGKKKAELVQLYEASLWSADDAAAAAAAGPSPAKHKEAPSGPSVSTPTPAKKNSKATRDLDGVKKELFQTGNTTIGEASETPADGEGSCALM